MHQDKALERQKVSEAEAAQLRQTLTSQAAGSNPTDTERCRQAEQLLAQQVCTRGPAHTVIWIRMECFYSLLIWMHAPGVTPVSCCR